MLTRPLIIRTALVAGIAVARTVAVNTIVMVQLVYLFNCRSLHHSVFKLGLLTNRWALGGALAMLGAQLLFTYAPVMNRLFHSAPISGGAWLRIACIAALAFVVVELEKWIRFGRGHDTRAVQRQSPSA